MKDPRIAKLIGAILRRFPGTTIITGPAPDNPYSGETYLRVLNAPMKPTSVVSEFAHSTIDELWGDDWLPVMVAPISPEESKLYYSEYLLSNARVQARGSPGVAVATPSRPSSRRRKPAPTRSHG